MVNNNNNNQSTKSSVENIDQFYQSISAHERSFGAKHTLPVILFYTKYLSYSERYIKVGVWVLQI